MKPVKVPYKIGYGEGGGRVPKLEELLNAVATDLEILYGEASVDDTVRTLLGSNEVPLKVVGTDPEDKEEDVDANKNIVITFNQGIEFQKTDTEAKAAIEVEDEDSSAKSVTTATIGGDGDTELTLDCAEFTANKWHTVTIPREETVKATAGFIGLSEDFVFSFKVEE